MVRMVLPLQAVQLLLPLLVSQDFPGLQIQGPQMLLEVQPDPWALKVQDSHLVQQHRLVLGVRLVQ